MGNSEGEKPAKSDKAMSPPREQSSVHVYPDWAAVQAYYGSGALPPPYFNPAATSGHGVQPYIWAPPQMMTPYGSPYAMYPHGGMYGPSAAPVVANPLSLETPAKSSGKDSGSGKMSKDSDVHEALGNGIANAESAGDGGVRGQSQSTDCGTEGSCERSYDSSAREDNSSRSCNGLLDTGTCSMQMNGVVPGIPMASVNPVGSSPMPMAETNHCSGARPNVNGVHTAHRQDERELKREKRKQSNRESARRSRLRKQAEMDELGKKVDSLNGENLALRSEISRLVEDSEKLRSENAALMDKLKNMHGQEEEMEAERTENQETMHINTENLLSRVNNSVFNGVHEQSKEK